MVTMKIKNAFRQGIKLNVSKENSIAGCSTLQSSVFFVSLRVRQKARLGAGSEWRAMERRNRGIGSCLPHDSLRSSSLVNYYYCAGNGSGTGTMLPLLHLLNVSRMLTAYLQCFTHSSSHAYSKRRILSWSKYACFHSLSTKSLIFRRATCVYPGASLETVIKRNGVCLWPHLSLTSL